MISTAVQQIMLGTVTKTEKQAAETLRLIKDAGYDGIELNGFMIRPTGFLVRTLTKFAGMPTGRGGKYDWKALVKDAGLTVTGIHEDLGSIKRDPEKIITEAREFGTEFVIVTGMYRFDYSDPAAVSTLSEDLNQCGKALKEGGISLLYHNHNCELLKISGTKESAYDYILSHTDPDCVNFEFDSYWMTDGGANAAAVMKKLGRRMKLWHVNDRGARVSGPQMTPILKYDSMELGYGAMDLDSLTEIAKENGIRTAVLESHRNWVEKSPIRSLQLSADYLNRQFHA